jgi:Winged helix DNA-binding domain
VRRYLAAYGPATAADVTAWSGVTRLGPVLAGMDDLERHEDEAGKVLYDVPGGVVEDEETPAPPRLLGTYDNVWLSHAGRDRVTVPEKRTQWMGVNGGVAMSLFVDGWLEGLWRQAHGRVEVIGTFRDLTRRERADLDEEIARVETLLAR